MRTALVCLCLVGVASLCADAHTGSIPVERGTSEIEIDVSSQVGPVSAAAGPARAVGYRGVQGDPPLVQVKKSAGELDINIEAKSALALDLPRRAIIDLDIEQVNGPIALQLDGLRVRELEVENGTGTTAVRADGALSDLESIEVEQIGGALQLALAGPTPELRRIDLEARGASVTCELSGGFPRLELLEVEGRGSPVNAKLTGAFAKLEQVELETTSGAVALDLAGLWTSDGTIAVVTTDGACEIRLPKDVGVILYPSTGSGKLQLAGLRPLKRERNRDLHKSYRRMVLPGEPTDAFVNDAYEKSPVTLTLDINTTTGDITVHEQ